MTAKQKLIAAVQELAKHGWIDQTNERLWLESIDQYGRDVAENVKGKAIDAINDSDHLDDARNYISNIQFKDIDS